MRGRSPRGTQRPAPFNVAFQGAGDDTGLCAAGVLRAGDVVHSILDMSSSYSDASEIFEAEIAQSGLIRQIDRTNDLSTHHFLALVERLGR